MQKWMKIRPREMGLFLGSVALIFLIRCAGLIFNNFAETAFLKRFGVSWLPVLYIVNPMITLFFLEKLSSIKPHLSAYRRLSFLLFSCGTMAFFIWVLMFMEGRFLYPILFVMKVQFETLLSVFFWNLGNELFNFHQSKRLFPLITIGGVLGDMGGNLLTVGVSQVVAINHLLLMYGAVLISAAVMTRYLGNRFPLQVVPKKPKVATKEESTFLKRIVGMGPLMKKSTLVPVMVGLTFFANVVLPIMNYQFNVAVDHRFGGENAMIVFFGTFRGAMNVVSILLLFFSGRFYGRWGIPMALLFHPMNYLLVFLGFLFRFDIFSAMYARFSTNVIRTTFNQPVNNMLIGIFPDEYRSRMRPFLRGVVARAGLITGSCLILLTTTVLPPHYLSIVALPFVVGWIGTVIFLKFKYAALIIRLLGANFLDLRSTEAHVIKKLFHDRQIQDKLLDNFKSSRGIDAFFHARLLKYLGMENLDNHILNNLKYQDSATVIKLLPLISGQCGDRFFRILKKMINVADEPLTLAMIRVAQPRNTKACRKFYQALEQQCRSRGVQTCVSPEIRAHSAACLLMEMSEHRRELMGQWMRGANLDHVHAAIIAVAESGETVYVSLLNQLLNRGASHERLLPALIRALKKLDPDGVTHRVALFLNHSRVEVRMAALEALEINDDDGLRRRVLALVGDRSDKIRTLAIEKIKICPHCNGRLLFEFLYPASRKMREGIFEILKALDIKDPDMFAFFEGEIRKACICLAVSRALEKLPRNLSCRLLIRHLSEIRHVHIQAGLRVASINDDSGQVRLILRSLFSRDHRRRSNALEALESTMHPRLVRQIMPFLDGTAPEDILKSLYRQPGGAERLFEPVKALEFLLQSDSRLTVRLARGVLETLPQDVLDGDIKTTKTLCTGQLFQGNANADRLEDFSSTEVVMENSLSFQEKIVYIQKVDIFKNLAINELAAISDIAQEVAFAPKEILFQEKEFADTMYICVEGAVSASRNNVGVGTFNPGDSFGMSAFLVDSKRLLTCRAKESTRLLEIHKQEFEEMLMEYPQISFEIAKIHARMIQRLLEQIQAEDTHESLMKDFFNKHKHMK
ncbi:cyclic nucleotide-binding domain-containing protein [Desulfocicer vacuolatum]|nr:cyclic nucleotide-binding domain-containing protein [Desulfocicer vacuolatum]